MMEIRLGRAQFVVWCALGIATSQLAGLSYAQSSLEQSRTGATSSHTTKSWDRGSGRQDGVAADSIWFTPNVASQDMLDLFTNPGLWSSARSRVNVFKFYDRQVGSSCSDCGPNTLSNFVSVDAFRKLGSWGIKIGVESAAIKSWSCDAVIAADVTRDAMQNIRNNGGTVAYVDLDEPWMSATLYCKESQQQAAQYVKNYIDRVRQPPFQAVLVGTEEAYVQNDPKRNRAALVNWIKALQQAGVSLPFFHLDVDLNGVDLSLMAQDMAALKNFCQNNGIVFGVLFAGIGSTNQAYYTWVIDWVTLAKSAVGMPQHSLFMSWAGSTALAAEGEASSRPGVAKNIPDNLPECGSFSHTRLVNDGLAILEARGNDSAYVRQTPPPSTVRTGQRYDVSVTMRNTGGSTWDSQFLGYAGQNSPWGITLIEVPAGTCAPPGNTLKFTFQVTAPAQPGSYLFRWRMKDELDGRIVGFGDTTPSVWVTVTR